MGFEQHLKRGSISGFNVRKNLLVCRLHEKSNAFTQDKILVLLLKRKLKSCLPL